MSVLLVERAINDLKWNYNLNLNRYYNGCEYLNKNKKDIEEWLPELIYILENVNLLLEEIMKYENVTELEILRGFEIKEKTRVGKR